MSADSRVSTTKTETGWPRYAKYTTNKALVSEIEGGESSVDPVEEWSKYKYVVGELISLPSGFTNAFFLDKERASMYMLTKDEYFKQPSTTVFKEWSDDGQLIVEWTRDLTTNKSTHKIWNSKGEIAEETRYYGTHLSSKKQWGKYMVPGDFGFIGDIYNGKLISRLTEYDNQGEVHKIHDYVDNTENCRIYDWGPKHRLIEEHTYLKDKRHGPSREWDRETGQLLMTCSYTNGKRNGLCQNWNRDGTIQSSCTYAPDHYNFERVRGVHTNWTYFNGVATHTDNYTGSAVTAYTDVRCFDLANIAVIKYEEMCKDEIWDRDEIDTQNLPLKGTVVTAYADKECKDPIKVLVIDDHGRYFKCVRYIGTVLIYPIDELPTKKEKKEPEKEKKEPETKEPEKKEPEKKEMVEPEKKEMVEPERKKVSIVYRMPASA